MSSRKDIEPEDNFENDQLGSQEEPEGFDTELDTDEVIGSRLNNNGSNNSYEAQEKLLTGATLLNKTGVPRNSKGGIRCLRKLRASRHGPSKKKGGPKK